MGATSALRFQEKIQTGLKQMISLILGLVLNVVFGNCLFTKFGPDFK